MFCDSFSLKVLQTYVRLLFLVFQAPLVSGICVGVYQLQGDNGDNF